MQDVNGCTALALNHNWLTDQSACQNMGNGLSELTTVGCYQPAWYYPNYSYPVYVTSPARPVTLTLSEVERLRKIARSDEKVKAILAKFTDLIEISVDFE